MTKIQMKPNTTCELAWNSGSKNPAIIYRYFEDKWRKMNIPRLLQTIKGFLSIF